MEEDNPSRMIFLVAGDNSNYMQKLVDLSIKGHSDFGISAKSTNGDTGTNMVLFDNGDMLLIQRLDKAPLAKLNNLEFYNNYLFVDYKVAPDLLYKTIEDAGLRNFVYKFGIVDERGI